MYIFVPKSERIQTHRIQTNAHYEFGKDIAYKFINFRSYLRNHEELMSFASNQISRLSNMSNPIQVKNENAVTSDWPTAPSNHGD
jgi:hypothetical protein